MTTTNAAAGGNEPIDWNALNQQVFADDPLAVALAAFDKGELPAATFMVDEFNRAASAAAAAELAAPTVRELEPATEAEGDTEPVAAQVEVADEDDPDADTHLWPALVDEKGRATGELARPNPEAMRVAMKRAAATSADDVAVLAEAISEPEARDIIDLAVELRGVERELGGKVTRRRLELASESARKQAEHDAHLADVRRRRENRTAAALERRARALDPTSRIVRLAAAERIVPWIAVLPAALAAGLGAVNVGVQLDALSPGTHVINWLVEPLITLPIIAILIAQILGAVGAGDKNPYRNLEWALVLVAVALNVGLHALVDGRFTVAAAVWIIVPGGFAISAHLVPKLIGVVREALADASVETIAVPKRAFATTANRSESTWTAPEPSQVSAESTPELRTEGDILAEFAAALQNGRIDPQTSQPMDPKSAESIRRTLNVGKARGRALRDRFLASDE
jgi:hypothetical protein